ncbi:MAG: hypothetical protein GEV11_19130 [Streptosporangiales bacterium]|nr:hypothetical protein [Streptosporangiales bacterium]
MSAYALTGEGVRGVRVAPARVSPELAELVPVIQRVAWPIWPEPNPRMLRELSELCRLQAARGLTVLSWLAEGDDPGETGWLLPNRRLAGPRQERMYAAAAAVPEPVHDLVASNWRWALGSPYGGRVIAPYFAGGAYPDDGFAAAHAAIVLLRVWERHAELRPSFAAAWAATRTPSDWLKAAELHEAHGERVVVFAYPGGAVGGVPGLRPWITRLMRTA